MTKNRISRCLAALALLCVMVMLVAVPLASAASYSKVYGQTLDRIRVRESASTNATIIDNIVKNACVYVTSSKTSGGSTFVQIKYRNLDGDVVTGWACQSDGNETYIKILSADQAKKAFSVSGGKLPSKKVGTFTSAERKASAQDSDNSYIKLNSTGTAVKNLQTKLQKLGYYSAELTGKCGPKTEQAIKDFQEKNGLTADGVAGPQTLAKIDAAYNSGSTADTASGGSGLRLNSTGKDVSALQTDLTTLGYYWAEITGKFGEKTETAVKRFQEENNLKADGVAGKKTLDAIAAAVAAKGGISGSLDGSVLKLNSQGTKVSQLQTDLMQLGYYYAEITGKFGEKTEAAVKEFQKKNGLYADGVAGSNTLKAIEAAVKKIGGTSAGSAGVSGLRLGSTGKEVGDLQENLTTLGFYYGDITNHFGQLTQAAVKKFQKSRGMTQDGVAGKQTLAAIASAVEGTGSTPAGSTGTALREGDTGAKVGDLQTRLKSLGYYYGEVTKHFGTLTKQAVKKFQDDNKLTVDGIAGTATLNKLYSLTGGGSTSGSTAGGNGSGSSVTMENSYGRITKNNVNLRSKATTTSAAVASLKQDTLVRISKVYTGGDGVKWYYVSVGVGNYTYKGYIRSDMMTTISEAEYNNAGGNSNVNTGDQETLGMIVITGDKVRLRYNPSTDAQTVGQANRGDVFYYVDSVSGWFQTKAGYWISKDYARVMTSDEIKNYTGIGDVTTTYRYGSTGSGVIYIQTALTQLGYYKHEISGHFGNNTEDAVKAFQRDNGISADGIVGKNTMAKLNEKYSSGGGGSSAETKYDKVVYNLSWTKYKGVLNNLGLTRGNKGCKLTDLWTGKSFNIYVQSTGNHADVEPLTKADTATMCAIYGVGSADSISWERRPMLMTIGAVQVVCSVYGDSHGQQDITDNSFDGQFCVHFLNSTNHGSSGGTIPDGQNHQDMIAKAVQIMKDKGSEVRTEYVTAQEDKK